jgi:hypothetical protein
LGTDVNRENRVGCVNGIEFFIFIFMFYFIFYFFFGFVSSLEREKWRGFGGEDGEGEAARVIYVCVGKRKGLEPGFFSPFGWIPSGSKKTCEESHV